METAKNTEKQFSWNHRTQYYETDQMGIVHHSNYIRWFEEARVEFLNQIGYSFKHLEEAGILCPVTGVSCEYKSMVHFSDDVVITAYIESFNGVKLTVGYRITDSITGELRAAGKSHHCFLDKNALPLRLKKTHPDLFELMTYYSP